MAVKLVPEIESYYKSVGIPTGIHILKLSFRNTLITTGLILVGLGTFAISAHSVQLFDIPDFAHKGNLITGTILFSIGIYLLLLGILEDTK